MGPPHGEAVRIFSQISEDIIQFAVGTDNLVIESFEEYMLRACKAIDHDFEDCQLAAEDFIEGGFHG